MIKIICTISLMATLGSCSKSKGTFADVIENVLEENQGVKIEITPQKSVE